MKKRIFGLVLCLLLVAASVLTGCSLITTDMVSYNKATVAYYVDKETGKRTNISKRDLIEAYNSYGYYYEQNYGDRERAIELTIDMIISRQLTVKACEELYPELSTEEKTYLWSETLSSLEDNLEAFVNQVLGNNTSSSSNNSTSSDAITFNKYEKNATLEKTEDGYVIKKTQTLQKMLENYKVETPRDYKGNENDRKALLDAFFEIVDSGSATQSKAFTEYFKQLKENEEGMKLSKTRESVFGREMDRLYKANYENYMIQKYSEHYQGDSNKAGVTTRQILDTYANEVKTSYVKYMVENGSDYESSVLGGVGDVKYFKTKADDTKFYYVSHVLFKFSDEQQKLYTQYKNDLDNNKITEEEYNDAMDALYDSIIPTVRRKNENGEYVEVGDDEKEDYEKSSQALYEYICETVENAGKYSEENSDASNQHNLTVAQQKAEAFNEFIYKYNDDPGIRNAEYNYVMGVNASEAYELADDSSDLIELSDGRKYKKYSQMVEEFTLEGAELYNDGKGQVGDLSGLVRTENGLHIMFYAGEVTNLFDGINENFALSDDAIVVLYHTRLNACTDKTVFDLIYDKLASDKFSTFENLNLNELKNKVTVKLVPSEYKDLLK